MSSIARSTPSRKFLRPRRYAWYGDVYGIASLVPGGYCFRGEDGTRRLASYNDPQLLLLGLVDLADAQHAADTCAGGPAAIACARQEGTH